MPQSKFLLILAGFLFFELFADQFKSTSWPELLYKSFNLSALLYAILVVLATKGYLEWNKIYGDQAH